MNIKQKRHNKPLTSVQEDFVKIGLVPASVLAEEVAVGDHKDHDANNVYDIPSPDPSTLPGLDDSEADKSAQSAKAKQPSPKKSPDDDAEYDVDTDGGADGALKGGKYAGPVVGQMEAKEIRKMLDKVKMAGAQGGKYTKAKPASKEVADLTTKGGHPALESFQDKLDFVETILGEMENEIVAMEAVENLSDLISAFKLVSENAAMLSNGINGLSEAFEIEESLLSFLEELSEDAAQMALALQNDDDLEETVETEDGKEVEDGNDDPTKPRSVVHAKMKAEDKVQKAEETLEGMTATIIDVLEDYKLAVESLDEEFEDSGDVVSEDEVEFEEPVAEASKDDDDDEEEEDDEDDSDDDDSDDEDEKDDDKDDKKEESLSAQFDAIKKAIAEGKQRLASKVSPKRD